MIDCLVDFFDFFRYAYLIIVLKQIRIFHDILKKQVNKISMRR